MLMTNRDRWGHLNITVDISSQREFFRESVVDKKNNKHGLFLTGTGVLHK
jgi:hypothetical protein